MLLDKQNLPLVAMEFMNDVHTEDIDIINELFDLILKYENDSTKQNEDLLNNKYEIWFEHTVKHFNGEEVMMQEKQFPPYPMHKREHDNALARMKNLFDTWNETKDIMVLKTYFIEELPTWLINHIKTMDTVTAMFLKTGLSPCQARH